MKTYGFDYVYALSIDAVNKILARSGIGASVEYYTVDPETGWKINLCAQLGPWRIVGGSNTLLDIDLPIANGSLKIVDGTHDPHYDLEGVVATMEISLGWMGAGSSQDATGSGGSTQLVFRPDDTKDKNNPGYVATLQIRDPKKHLDSLATGLIRRYMADALVSNKENLKYIFAHVNPFPAGPGSWLQAKKWLYYYFEAASTKALCFLCMLSDAAFPDHSAFDPYAFSADSNCVILISQQQFFNQVLLPAVRAAFPGGTFVANCPNDLCALTNSGSFSAGKLPANHLTAAASSDGSAISISFDGGGPLKFLFGLADLPDASYSWSVQSKNYLSFNGQQIGFWNTEIQIRHDANVPWYDWVLLAVTGITNIAGLLSFILGLVNQFDDQFQQVGVGSFNANIQSVTGGAAVNLGNLINWQSSGLTATAGGLSGALYVRANVSGV